MRITLESYGETYIFETDKDDYNASELKEIFSRMLVLASFPPDVLELSEGGHYECNWVEDK